MTIQRYEIGVRCGMYCLGGSATLTPTDYPDDADVVKITDHLAAIAIYESRLAEDAKVRAGLVAALELALSYTESHLLKVYERDELEKMQAALSAAKEIK